ncbi:diguanylate cyclase [Candidatus Woesearchaeota archaeon]|nr:diguanylate cyclase [Candidatus Woesearchaeota archaeon]
METKVDPRFGRSRYFMIVKVHDKEITHHKAVENIGGKQMHGAGIKAAEQAGELKADKIITGNIGPNASNVLTELGIEVYEASGDIRKAAEDLIEGRLKKIDSNVGSHFGMKGGNRK